MAAFKYYTLLATGCRACCACWNPRPVSQPQPPANLQALPFLERATVGSIYAFLCLEYSISKNGGLREWIKLNILLAITAGIPVLLLLPVICLLAGQLYELSFSLQQIVTAIFYTVLYGLGTVALLTAAGIIWRSLSHNR